MSTIVVLVKNVPDTWSIKTLNPDFTLHREGVDEVIDEINEYAVEQALQLREANEGFRVVALSMGPQRAETALRKALAMGADDAVLVTDPSLAGSDMLGTAWVLHNALNALDDVQLIVAGNASSDGGCGALPGMLAEYRQLPALTNLRSLTLADGQLAGVRESHDGEYHVTAPLPAIVSVTEQSAKPRFPNFKGLMAAKKAAIRTLTLAEIGVAPEQVGLAHAVTVVRSAETRPERTSGEIVRSNGAAEIIEFLAAQKLI
ncbi:electron transfer flavoprotein subunit beta/FixA family protein [Corynebacterium sp.]|uniref:electron transfer flavoprotein subunit beta/FixA family protein n=1 Tax=Corynebacterium sp. TaxID=1720 RepID=UPI0026DA98C2|nr:electron transfer flavoprotein subunit beta/FixA family protein [Corynebacterium sp.]MDO5076607.1 electron transfer flavoprotein subunit beta/FixA family protein [Corynebacterium sp.]